MFPPLIPLRDTHIIGSRCKEWIIGRGRVPQFYNHNIVCVGHSILVPPYRMVRLKSDYALLVACTGGKGVFYEDGQTRQWPEGKLLICPQGAQYAYEAVSEEPWRITWVLYLEASQHGSDNSMRARLVEADCEDFNSCAKMLIRETSSEAAPAAIESLTSLLRIHMQRLDGGDCIDSRVSNLWSIVESDLGANWDNTKLAQLAKMSEEHLRRLCLKHYGKSPIKHLQHLRMHSACIRLRTGNCKIETIAESLGFSSLYAFSAAFKRWAGVSPGQFRSHEKQTN
ncbi:MAG: helix-turn-helix domain-containing protein [Opitutales bacterium]|nr:helix-turn-helix domain-containing protein [Opitutales bacterium]